MNHESCRKNVRDFLFVVCVCVMLSKTARNLLDDSKDLELIALLRHFVDLFVEYNNIKYLEFFRINLKQYESC
jgi:hypothetical protein